MAQGNHSPDDVDTAFPVNGLFSSQHQSKHDFPIIPDGRIQYLESYLATITQSLNRRPSLHSPNLLHLPSRTVRHGNSIAGLYLSTEPRQAVANHVRERP